MVFGGRCIEINVCVCRLRPQSGLCYLERSCLDFFIPRVRFGGQCSGPSCRTAHTTETMKLEIESNSTTMASECRRNKENQRTTIKAS